MFNTFLIFQPNKNGTKPIFWRKHQGTIVQGEYCQLTGHWFWTPVVKCGCNDYDEEHDDDGDEYDDDDDDGDDYDDDDANYDDDDDYNYFDDDANYDDHDQYDGDDDYINIVPNFDY